MAQQPERESSDEKYPPTLILSPDPELSTPIESRNTTCPLGGNSPSVKLMSSRENKKISQNQSAINALSYVIVKCPFMMFFGSVK